MKTLLQIIGFIVLWLVIVVSIILKPILAAWLVFGVILFYVYLAVRTILKVHFNITIPHFHNWKRREHNDEHDILICMRCNKQRLVEKDD